MVTGIKCTPNTLHAHVTRGRQLQFFAKQGKPHPGVEVKVQRDTGAKQD